MFRVIITAVVLVLLAVLIVLNAGNTAAFNFYGLELKDAPIIAVAILAFVAGILYSFLFYVIRFLDRRRRDALRERARKVAEREKRVDRAESAAAEKKGADAAERESTTPPRQASPGLLARAQARLRKLFR